MVAKDATFLISLATEEFIKRLSEASKRVAERERRSTVQHKDIGTWSGLAPQLPPDVFGFSYCRTERRRVRIPRRWVVY